MQRGRVHRLPSRRAVAPGAPPASGLGVRAFLAQVPQAVRGHLPQSLQGFESRQAFSFVQLHYGDPRVHYEVWVQRRVARVEIGLHFEAAREENHQYLALLADRFEEIVAGLGPGPELEEWTASWTRLHETWPLDPLTESLLDRVAARLAAYVAALQPLLTAGHM